MPRNRSTSGGANPNNAVETVIASLPNVSTQAGNPVDLDGTADLTGGTSTTAVVLRIRRGVDATGALVGSAVTCNIAAGVRDTRSIQATDTPPGDLAGATYVLTAQQTGGTGAGTLNSAYLGAIY